MARSFVDHRWDSPRKLGFAPDSPLEGFEPSVPRERDHGFRECLLDLAMPTPCARETDGSNPNPSARPLSSGDIDIACFRYKRSIFFDAPEDEGIRLEHPGDILAPQKRLLELAEWDIGDHLPETSVHGLDQGLLLFRIGFLDVLLAQSLFLFVARPTDQILAVTGHDRRWTDQRACELRAVGAGMKKVPAALIRRVLFGAAR